MLSFFSKNLASFLVLSDADIKIEGSFALVLLQEQSYRPLDCLILGQIFFVHLRKLRDVFPPASFPDCLHLATILFAALLQRFVSLVSELR